MTDQFMNQIFKTSVAAVCQKMGWDAAQTSAIDVLADLWKRQLSQLGKTCHRYAEHYGRTEVNHDDVALAFREMNVSIPELEEYVLNFDPVRLPYKTPSFPVKKQSHLNFLRPGSKEVLTRPVHIHEYLPPWEIPEGKDDKVSNGEINGFGDKDDRKNSASSSAESSTSAPESTKPHKEMTVKIEEPEPFLLPEKTEPNKPAGSGEGENSEHEPPTDAATPFKTFAGSTKRGSSAGENPALKRVRILMEEEGHPLRQITSVMMTTSGFLSSSREGRLPDSRPPPNRDFFDAEPVVEKKKKIVTMKKIVEGVKKIEKENQDEVEVELFGKPDRLVVPEGRSKSDSSKKESARGGEGESKARHAEKESKSKLKIFKKKSRDAEKHKKEESRRPQVKVEIKVEQDLEEVSSEEGSRDGFHRHEPVDSLEDRKKRRKAIHQSRKERKRDRSDRLVVPGVVPIPRISPTVIINEIKQPEGGRERESMKRKHKKVTSLPFGDEVQPPKFKKMRHLTDVKSLIPEITIKPHKALPPLPELKPFFGSMQMAPGLIPANLGPPPPLRFGGSNLSSSITITPAASSHSVSSKESGRKGAGSSLPLPSNVCSSVTITRIDMPSQESSAQYENSPTPGIGIHLGGSGGKQSPLPIIQSDSSSGITITPILMTGDSGKSERFEKAGGSGGALAKLEEDLRSKDQRRKDKEKRKELKKEKKKEKRDKLREKERVRDKDEKVVVEKKERKDKGKEVMEPTVPKLTLKIPSSNTSTPVDSPNPNRGSERTDTPPPPRKIIIKPIEDLVKPSSPEMARFSPLVTRPPKEKVHKVNTPKPSPPVVAAPVPEKSLERKSSLGKSSKSRSKASTSSQSALVTETVGFYIDEHGTKVWVCPAQGCGREDDGSPMIGCDLCDDWYHFDCVGIEVTPRDDEHWYCPRCVKKGARKGR